MLNFSRRPAGSRFWRRVLLPLSRPRPFILPLPALRVGLIAGGTASLVLLTTILARPHAQAQPAPATPPLNGGAIYVGEAICIACHAEPGKQFDHTTHANGFRLNPKNEKEKLSCEACHGPGSNHLKNPADPANRSSLIGFTREWGTPIAQQTAMCMSCHEGGQRMFWAGSPHATNALSCSDCHNPMAKISATGLLKKATINETCYTCHQQQRADFAKRSHMPVNKGKLSCVDYRTVVLAPCNPLIISRL